MEMGHREKLVSQWNAMGGLKKESMAKLNDDQRRILKTLAHQDGCAEAALLADGFSIDQLAGLVVQGYAVMQRRRVEIGGRMRGRGLDADHRDGPGRRSRTERPVVVRPALRGPRAKFSPLGAWPPGDP